MAKTTRKPVDTSKPRPGLEITSKRESFWRCGRQFFRTQPTVIPLDELEADEIERLQGDPDLVVQVVEIAPVDTASA